MMRKLTIFAIIVTNLVAINPQVYIPNAIKNLYGRHDATSGSSYSGRKTPGVKTVLNPSYSYKPSYGGVKTGGRGSYFSPGSGSYQHGGMNGDYQIGEGYQHGYQPGGASYYPSYGGHGNFRQDECDPPCQNGGKCVGGMMCLCATEFVGAQCQYNKAGCAFKNLNFNGAYKCSEDNEAVTCTISCPQGSTFDYTPASKYICYHATAQYQPSLAPQCILDNKNAYWTKNAQHGVKDSKIIHINMTKTGKGPHQQGRTYVKVMPRPGICFTWGGSHYKTFDGKVFSFSSKCSHVLVRDGVDNTFEITVENSKDCTNSESCYRIVKIFLGDKQYYLKQSDKGVSIFGSPEKVLSIPSRLPGLRVSKSAHFIIITLDSVGAKLKWDGEQLVQVEVAESLWNKTEGLCGRIDGDSSNDIMTKNKRKPKNVYTLATSWKADGFGEVCSDVPSDKHACGADKVATLKATTFCKKLLNDKRFHPCATVMETLVLLDACKWDYCSCPKKDPTECACETMNVYVRECSHKGITAVANWRDENTCPIKCTGGRVYQVCAPAYGQPVCGSVTEPPETEETCVEGCFCPQGTVLHENQCILKNDCPCKLRGKSFKANQVIKRDCNTCTCLEGQWICTELSCGARCSIIGDPHYTTFDGKHYDFMGQCAYYLVKTGNFSIEAENVACSGSISHSMNFGNTITAGAPSCTKSVTIRIGGKVIALKQNHDVIVDGIDIHTLPYKNSEVYIKWVTSTFIHVKLPNDMTVWWDGATRAYIDVPANFNEQIKGLCGTYNNNQNDDFLTPENDVEQGPIPFANKWKTSEKCTDLPNILTPHPCDVNVHKKNMAELQCGKIKSQMFQECQWRVDVDQFYQDCLYDVCSCGGPTISTCLCPIIAAYAEECSKQGLQIDWRSEIAECGIQCSSGQTYQICGNACFRTCADISEGAICDQQCVEGCNCPEGQALDDNGECVTLDQCNCRSNGVDYPPGFKEVKENIGGPLLCTCMNAIWSCNPATTEDLNKYTEPKELKSRCNDTDNFEFTTCKSSNQITCKNMHSPPLTSDRACFSGCQCKKGYVLDTTTQRCINPSQCPCHHGGKSFAENERFQIDCNSCICNKGKWRCSEKQCGGECTAWGDSHYKTFDGKHYDYQGQCDYVLSKGSLTTGSFDISIQNVPCGSLGTSCSKSISIRISLGADKESVTLTRGKFLAELSTFNHMTLREKGLFVIIEVPDLDLVVIWDRGTRVYVKLAPLWKGKVKGLCGNYNDNIVDDFLTPSGGITEVSSKIFGDSWRLQSYCPEALEITDTCEGRPDRKIWALKKCGLLKSPLFSRCHPAVPIEDYFNKCVFDTCACDEGGDCECLCTALATYAEECNNKGVHIKWRSQELCPIQCDERCSIYSPCVSTCPTETCENLKIQSKLSRSCGDESCVEGCELKKCPPGQVYYNSSSLECVPRKLCKTVCLEVKGVTYYEGDVIEEDDCHSCYCSRGQKICKGQPCEEKGAIPPEQLPQKPESLVKCKNGWSKWINQHKIITATKTKTAVKRSDKEPIPTIQFLSTLDSAVCSKEHIKKVQCRTAKSHIRWNETGINLDITCNLDDGLVCKPKSGKSCPDFEIRVLCECGKKPNRTIEDINNAIEPKKCPPGTFYDDCAIECDQMCLLYNYAIKERGLCQNGEKCESGCVPVNKQKTCPPGTAWINNQTCVAIQDCMCRARDGTPVKPGTVFQESDCEFCQCIDNFYTCDASACQSNVFSDETEVVEPESEIEEVFEEFLEPPEPKDVLNSDEILIPNTATPPNKCEEEDYVNLIEGDVPLSDDAFNASSTANNYFSPWFAKLNSKVSDNSGGSWIPKFSTPDQYLEVNLGRLEPIYGVIVRGSPLYDEYVTSYQVFYSPDGHKYCYVVDEKNKPQIFRGSLDSTSPVKEMFPVPIEAKVIRINPLTWNNQIALRIELIGCRDSTSVLGPITPTSPPISTSTTTTTKYDKEPMGIGDGTLVEEQITVSSELSPKHNKTFLKIDEEFIWQPQTNSPTEFVQFDFLDKRMVSCVVTKGGPNGWVTSYKVLYSINGKDWSPVLDENLNEQQFLGNFDGKSIQTNCFKRPINTRYIKIVPVKWHKNIQMQVELLGKFVPYPVTTTEIKPAPTETKCKYCPGVVPEDEDKGCKCDLDHWYDGEICVSKAQCPCFVRNNPYPVGVIFENEDCDSCICKLGGIPYCTPKKCFECPPGLKSFVTNNCECTCQPCPEGTVLCRSSNVCIDSDSWCDGIQDCPDDELNCDDMAMMPEGGDIKPGFESTTKKPISEETCSITECPIGFSPTRVKETRNYLSPMFSGYNRIKSGITSGYSGIKSGIKSGGVKKPLLKRPINVNLETKMECPEFSCIPTKVVPTEKEGGSEIMISTLPPNWTEWPGSTSPPLGPSGLVKPEEICPEAICPPDYILVYDPEINFKTVKCPSFTCDLPPPPEAVCNVTADTFNTFDGIEFEYDICDHVIARDLENEEWDVSMKKNCTERCTTNLMVRHDNNVLVLHSDLAVEYDGYMYTVDQTKKIGSQTKTFSLSRLGNTLLFTSNRFGFWIIWDKQSNVKLGVVRKLSGKVDGLCGYFNEDPLDDKRKPDGSLARTTSIFGDSWGLVDKSNCEEKRCPIQMQNEAFKICNEVKDASFALCADKVDVQAFISRCVETTCDCLETADGTLNREGEEECKCLALQSFVIDCLSAEPDIDLSHWRIQHDCPATCNSPLVYHDCYQRKCEPTCDTISDSNACPKVPQVCFPGCYCPPGLVKKGDNCIQPSSCRDCECNVLPHLKYVTYDENNFTIDGNCTYIMSRDIISTKTAEHNFEVLITNGECMGNKRKTCVQKVTILVKKHKIEVFNNIIKKELKVIVDGKATNDFDAISKWIGVRKTATKHLKLQLKGIQVEISVYYPSLGVSIKVPSHKYGGKLEGLCGNCNKDPNDDIPSVYSSTPENIDKLALDWFYKKDSKDKGKCKNKPLEDCEDILPESDPCSQLLDLNKFGQCLRILDPGLFMEWCKKDTCGNHPELACTAIEAYASDCANAGFCINWRTNICPAKTCPPGLIYSACGPSCPKTCESLKKQQNCIDIPVEGCFCPEEKVLLNNTCVEEKFCEVCDEDGHHPGETWKKDKCTTCQCEGISIKCETQQCAGLNTVCEKGFAAVKVPAGKDECCDKYSCVPQSLVKPTCETPQKLVCGPGQTMKLDTKSTGCQQFVCECKPPEECESLDVTTDTPLQDGYVKEVDNTGCCPVVNLICKKELCPKPPQCPPYHNLDAMPGKCCPSYKCQPPKDKCIYETAYAAAEKGGERLRTKFEKQQLVKNINETWKDGPCRDCKCMSSISGDILAACTQTECSPQEASPDYEEYVLESQLQYDQCCPKIVRTACKYDQKIYSVGEKWTKNNDFCTTFECVDSPNGIQKEILVTSCDNNCDLGYEYEPPTKESKKCCGTCKQTACVVDGVVHQIDEEWKSTDFCTNYFCVFANGSAQTQAFLINCPKVPEDYYENYVFETTSVVGECCEKYTVTGCKIDGKIYKVGETAFAPGGDWCKEVVCTKNEKGEIVKEVKLESCNRDCAKGYEYKEPENDKCCGECVPVFCILGDELKSPGEQWASDDFCTTYTCDNLGDQLTVSAQQESCPSIEGCPIEKIYVKGCCKYCNITTASQVMCSPTAVPLPKTIGLVKANHTSHGYCLNKKVLNGFMECIGSCHSALAYNSALGVHESTCECCQGIKYKPTEIDLTCQDNYVWKKKISVPVSCKCQRCGGSTIP